MKLLDRLTAGVEEHDTVEESVTQFVRNLAAVGREVMEEGEQDLDEFWNEVERAGSNLAAAVAANTRQVEADREPPAGQPAQLHPHTTTVGNPLLQEPGGTAPPTPSALSQVAPQPQPPAGPGSTPGQSGAQRRLAPDDDDAKAKEGDGPRAPQPQHGHAQDRRPSSAQDHKPSGSHKK